jgi:hypothetical protein
MWLLADISPWHWLALAAIAAVLYFALRPRYDFRITVRGGGVDIQGAFPAAKRGALASFFARDVTLPQTVRIYGRRQGKGRWKLVLRGRIDRWEKQRIRNFLLTVL